MNTFTRRVITFLLCCWLPLPGLALATVQCHLLDSAMAKHAPATSQSTQENELAESQSEHTGCGTAVSTAPAEAQTPCNHCQMACHHLQLLLISNHFTHLIPEPHAAPDYAIPLPQVVFLNSPQRPPQAI